MNQQQKQRIKHPRGSWWRNKWDINEKTEKAPGQRAQNCECQRCGLWWTAITCQNCREPWGVTGPNLAFYQLEIYSEKEDRRAPLIANLFPWKSHIIAQGSCEGKKKNQEKEMNAVQRVHRLHRNAEGSLFMQKHEWAQGASTLLHPARALWRGLLGRSERPQEPVFLVILMLSEIIKSESGKASKSLLARSWAMPRDLCVHGVETRGGFRPPTVSLFSTVQGQREWGQGVCGARGKLRSTDSPSLLRILMSTDWLAHHCSRCLPRHQFLLYRPELLMQKRPHSQHPQQAATHGDPQLPELCIFSPLLQTVNFSLSPASAWDFPK